MSNKDGFNDCHHTEMSFNKYSSRRRFLQFVATSTVGGLAGCGNRLQKRRRRQSTVDWPPPKPDRVPDINEVPNVGPPKRGGDSGTRVAVYQDIGTSEAGKFFHENIPKLRDEIKNNRIFIIYRDFPLPWNDWTYPVAIACRSVQYHAGQQAFWPFAKQITRQFRPNIYYTKERILEAAEDVGVSRSKIKDDVENWRFYALVKRDKRRGEEHGINSVPRSILGSGQEQIVMSGAAAGRIMIAIEREIEDRDSKPDQ